MPRETRLQLRGTTYQFRVRVPKDVRWAFPGVEVTKSLGTGRYADAVVLCRVESVAFDGKVIAARRGAERKPMDEGTIRAIADDVKRRWLASDDRRRLTLDDDGWEAAAHGLELDAEVLRLALSAQGSSAPDVRRCCDVAWGEAQESSEASGIILPDDHPDRARVVRAVLTAELEAVAVMERRQAGEPVPTPDDRGAVIAPRAASLDDGCGGPAASQLVNLWAERQKRRPKTEHEWRRYWRRFGELHGDMPVKAITTSHVRSFRDMQERMPAYPSDAVRKRPMPEVVAWADAQGDVSRVSRSSVQKALASINSVLGWARQEGYIEQNPAAMIRPRSSGLEDDDEGREPYDADDLAAIFERSPVFAKGERPKGGRGEAAYWLPVLALYTGARQTELAQLALSNVICEGAHPYLDLRKGSGQSLKTKASRRRIPLHPRIIDLGFLDYVKRVAGGGHARLFPGLDATGEAGDPISAWSKWWGRYTRSLGIVDARKVFHSFRHGFKDALRRGRVAEDDQLWIMGHSRNGVAGKYGKGTTLDVLCGATIWMRGARQSG